mgnify:CR=1 FL=1
MDETETLGKMLIEIKDMRKIYNPGENEVHALDGIDLTICEREFDIDEYAWLFGCADFGNLYVAWY